MTDNRSLPRQIMAIWLPRLALDRWRQAESCSLGEGVDAPPTALITETAHGPRIDAANDAALAAGARPGSMLADARTVCPALRAVPSDVAGDLAFLERLALWARRWGPWSMVDPPDGLLIDVTAVAHLFGGMDKLLYDACSRFADRELAARVAVAPTAGGAWALAHYGPNQAVLAPFAAEQGPPPVLAALPAAALRLDPETLLVLRRLGLRRIGDLHGIARDSLQRRFRKRRLPEANPLLRLDQLLGRLPEPLLPVVSAPDPLVQRRLLEPIRHRPLLDRVLEDLARDMAGELEALGRGARRLELGLWRVDGEVILRELEMAQATRESAHICRLFASRLDDVDAGFGIEMLRLRATWSEPLALAQQALGAAEEPGISLAACVDRLTVRLGQRAVRCPVPRASHLPERAQRWHPPLGLARPSQEEFAFHPRPLKLLDKAEAISVLYATPDGYPRQFRWRGGLHEVARVEGPERIAPEWWRERSSVRLRDYYRIEDAAGGRYWIYRSGMLGDGRGGLPEWFLHALCA